MATWEDGPEYAPYERPDEFADPSAATVGLEAPPAVPPPPPAPLERPVFDDPGQPVPPLATLVPPPPAERDPHQPFDVASSLVTAESSAWASTHWAAPPSSGPAPTVPGQPAPTVPGRPATPASGQAAPYAPGAPSGLAGWPATNGQQPTGNGQHPIGPTGNGQRPASSATSAGPTTGYPPELPSPAGQPGYGQNANGQPGYGQNANGQPGYGQPGYGQNAWTGYPPPPPGASAAGSQPFPAPGQPATGGPFPAPGTPQWFTPGGYPPPMPPAAPPNARTVLAAVTPGVLLTLVIGGFIAVLAPVTIVVAFLLSSRMTYGRKVTRTAFAAVLAFLGLVGLLSLITADGLFSQWWDTVAGWACFGSWVMIVAAVIAGYRALKQGRPDPPPTPRR